MKPFQISPLDREDMKKLLVDCFGFNEYIKNSEDRLDSQSGQPVDASQEDPDSTLLCLLEALLKDIVHYLLKRLDLPAFSVGAQGVGFTAGFSPTDDRDFWYSIDESAFEKFFWDSLIALYEQLEYESSRFVSVRRFFKDNLEKYGVKYDSYTDYLIHQIYEKSMGEYLGIRPSHPERPVKHPKRLMRNCFPEEQYILIRSFAKSPYSAMPDSKSKRLPSKMAPYLKEPVWAHERVYGGLEIDDFCQGTRSAIKKFFEKKAVCEGLSKCERAFEEQLSMYIVEQAYCYDTYSQIVKYPYVADELREIRSGDKILSQKIKAGLEDIKNTDLAAIAQSDADMVKFLGIRGNIAKYQERVSSLNRILMRLSDVGNISAVLLRPYLFKKALEVSDLRPPEDKKTAKWVTDPEPDWAPIIMGWSVLLPEEREGFNPFHDMAYTFIPVVQSFYREVLQWNLSLLDSQTDFQSLLKELLMKHMDKWRVSFGNVATLNRDEGSIVGLLYEFGRENHWTVDAIGRESEQYNLRESLSFDEDIESDADPDTTDFEKLLNEQLRQSWKGE